MRKFLKALPIVIILALIFAISVSATHTSFTLGTRQYYSKSSTVFGKPATCTMWVDSTSGSGCKISLFGYSNINYPEAVDYKSAGIGGYAHTDETKGTKYTSWYGYMQPNSSSGLGGSATGQASAM